MTSELSQRTAVASRVERLVERAMTFAIDEHDDDLALARLAWLAQDDQAALEEASEVCLGDLEIGLVVRARATGLLARVRHHDLPAWPIGSPRAGPARQPGTDQAPGSPQPTPSGARRRPPSMHNQTMVSYGEWSAVQAGIGGQADLEGATANMSTEVGDLDAALATLYQLPLEQFVATRDQLARRLRAAGDRATARQVAALRRPPVSAWAASRQQVAQRPTSVPSSWLPSLRTSPTKPRRPPPPGRPARWPTRPTAPRRRWPIGSGSPSRQWRLLRPPMPLRWPRWRGWRTSLKGFDFSSPSPC